VSTTIERILSIDSHIEFAESTKREIEEALGKYELFLKKNGHYLTKPL
jgi:hypothetical protein